MTAGIGSNCLDEQIIACGGEKLPTAGADLTIVSSMIRTVRQRGSAGGVPTQRRHGWDEIKGFSDAVAKTLAGETIPDTRSEKETGVAIVKTANPKKILIHLYHQPFNKPSKPRMKSPLKRLALPGLYVPLVGVLFSLFHCSSLSEVYQRNTLPGV